ncbi:MAG: hypothetical protein US02_C0019G0006 [Candidatus Levybacteria bacterium GW2011_GWA2_36_13]|nr:MAG: hypothetical protein US02_C0019G0006 [Candidatus Levybacteria bacterium GW2011_GWA2_36_13]OGH44322.1 MAG: hypothetical protein A3I49_02610 [Candidatus Levybacteria bacterium RIFCSPLOWO2_02_FULL_37_11]
MDKIKCPHCHKTFPMSEAIRHELEEKVRVEQTEKLKERFEKEKTEEVASERKKALQEAESKNKEKDKELEKQKAEKIELEKKLAKIEEDKKIVEENVKKNEAEKYRLDRLAYERKISSMQKSIDEAKRKGNQGSQQSQGDILEIDLKERLIQSFSYDLIKDVPTGIRGGDIVQEIKNKFGNTAGIILWETKRQKAWSKGWLVKLKDDMRKISASDCILVSDILPPNVKSYDRIDNVWVTSYEYAVRLAIVLRVGILNVAIARSGASHTDDNLRKFYAIVNSDKFRHALEARKEIIVTMENELEADKASTDRKWRRQAANIEKLKNNNRELVGMLEDHVPALKGLSESEYPMLEEGKNENNDQTLF